MEWHATGTLAALGPEWADRVGVGSGIRGSKLFLRGSALAALPNAEVIEGLARPIG